MNKVYEIVTDKIIKELEAGNIPWSKPWKSSHDRPKNLVSKKAYQGINTILLGMEGYKSPWWLTYKQAAKLGGNVKKGSKGAMVVFYKIYDKKKKDSDDTDRIPVLRYYKVFNSQQCEGLNLPPEPEPPTFNPIDKAESIIAHCPDKPLVEFGFNHACYIPSEDKIQLPEKTAFNSNDEFYSTFFHELVHSTKHESRLNRNHKTVSNFGSLDYSFEELVAEIGNSFLCSESGIEKTFKNSVAYIKGWLKVLKDDSKMVLSAAGKAEKAANYILNK